MTAETPTLAAALERRRRAGPTGVLDSVMADAALDWVTARLADPAAVEAVARALSIQDIGWEVDALTADYHHAASAAIEAVRALLVEGGEA